VKNSNNKGSIHSRLRDAREELGKTPEEFARPLGITYRQIYRYEDDVNPPTVMLLAIEYVYGINRRWLLNGQGDKWVKLQGTKLGALDIEVLLFLKSTDTNLYKAAIDMMQAKHGWDGIDRRRARRTSKK